VCPADISKLAIPFHRGWFDRRDTGERSSVILGAYVYALHMLNERLQILITKQQRVRLEAEARQRNVSVGRLIREAIDANYGAITTQERLDSVEQIGQLSGGRFLTPDEIESVIAEERAAAARPGADRR
jgi:hypothetical protein